MYLTDIEYKLQKINKSTTDRILKQ